MRVLLLTLITCALALPVQALYSAGSGTAEDPHHIATAEGLRLAPGSPLCGWTAQASLSSQKRRSSSQKYVFPLIGDVGRPALRWRHLAHDQLAESAL